MINFFPDLLRQFRRYHMRSLYLRLATLGAAVVVTGWLAGSSQAQMQFPENPPDQLREAIRAFDSQIELQPNGDLLITETLEFFTPSPRHGIFRQIPYRYNREGWRFTARVSQVEVTADGQAVPVEQSSDAAFLTLKIGDPDTTFTGPKTYQLRYRVKRAVWAAPNDPARPELYWDITGESWQIPILNTTATVVSPNPITSAECFSGAYGGNDSLCQLELEESSVVQLRYDQTIEYGENVTVRLGLDPSGPIQVPSSTQRVTWWIQDHWPLALLLLPPAFLINRYVKKGRDWWYPGSIHTPTVSAQQHQRWPWSMPAIPLVYEPPTDLTPGEASLLLHERGTNAGLVAEILDLARQKHITLERREKNKYWFVNQTPADVTLKLSRAQHMLLFGLFSGKSEVSLDSLKGTFHTTAKQVQAQLERQLISKKLITARPSLVRGGWITLGLLSTFLAGWGAYLLLSPFVPLLFWILAGLSLVICFLCAWAMPSRTAAGSNAAWKMKGLQRTIARGAWREKIKEKHLFVEEVLPYAVALGVARQLTRDLKDLHLEPPEYARAFGHNGVLMPHLVSHFTQSASSSFAPPSSSSSGWSGGGSSGGGGGGGGGGSW